MARKRGKGTELSVFKGREAKLNRAIFQILTTRSPLNIYDIHKQIQDTRGFRWTKYSTVNKRVKALQETGYTKIIGSKNTKAGFKTILYEPTNKFYLAYFLSAHDFNELISELDENFSMEILLSFLTNRVTKFF